MEKPYPRFSSREYERRHAFVKRLLEERGLELLLVHGNSQAQADILYLSQHIPRGPTWLILPLDGSPILLIHHYNHIDNVKAMSIVEDVRWLGDDPLAQVAGAIKEVCVKRRIGVVGLSTSIPYSQFDALIKALHLDYVDLGGELLNFRMVKSEEEIEWHKKGARLADLAMERLEEGLRPGITEQEIVALIHGAFLPEGGLPSVHFVSVTSMHDPDRRVPWQYPTPRAMKKGYVLNTELTCTYWGYGGQVHRPFALGEEPTPLYSRLYEVAVEAYERIVELLRPGTSTRELVEASSIIEERGFTTCDSLLHGAGVTPPVLGSKSSVYSIPQMSLKEGMVVTVQPNPTTLDGRAGVQVGSTFVVRRGGGENLHSYPLKFAVCGRGGQD